MRRILLPLLLLAGCSAAQQQQAASTVSTACADASALAPLVPWAELAAGIAPGGASAIAAAQGIVQGGCASAPQIEAMAAELNGMIVQARAAGLEGQPAAKAS